MTGKHDHWLIHALRQQRFEYGQPTDARHAYIEHDGADSNGTVKLAQNCSGEAVGCALSPTVPINVANCLTYGGIVVNQMDDGREGNGILIHALLSLCAGQGTGSR